MSSEGYSRLDRLLHRVAFASPSVQLAMAEVEDSLFAKAIAEIDVSRPVFITSLPRAGTTLLLEVLSAVPEFAWHSYRNMPFVLCPLLWEQLSRPFRHETQLKERAHGDGIEIGFDSPEAFEEIVWMSFWKGKYAADHIDVWTTGDRNHDFEAFFRQHIRKVIQVRRASRGDARPRRYLSKNNANISRLSLLPQIFKDCRTVIPFRNPVDHVGSLMRQHERFTAIHARDRFGLSYMEWLGHFEFGRLHRPIDFDGWTKAVAAEQKSDGYWLAYWVAANEALLREAGPNVCFFDYDRACAEPERMLLALGRWLALEDVEPLTAEARRFAAPPRYMGLAAAAGALESRARVVLESLRERSLQPSQ